MAGKRKREESVHENKEGDTEVETGQERDRKMT